MPNTKKNICLYFGSFNPVHFGHIAIAEYMVENKYADEVWFVISPQSPFKCNFTNNISKKKDVTSYFISIERRIELLEEAIQKSDKFRIEDIELSMPKPSYTIDTLRELSKRYDNIKFSLVIGSDQLKDFQLWREWQQIVNNYQIYVYPRDYADVIYCQSSMIFFEKAPLINISSTEMRLYSYR